MTELVLKSFNGITQHKSYGGNSLETNLINAEKVIKRVQYAERIWDRSRSHGFLNF